MSTIQTPNSSFAAHQVERVAAKRLWLAGLGAIVASVIVNSLIRIIALAAYQFQRAIYNSPRQHSLLHSLSLVY